jgi:hypothetical protein
MSSVLSVEKRSNEQCSARFNILSFFTLMTELSSMRAKKKPLGAKAQIRAEKERERRIATALFLTIILLAGSFAVYFGYTIMSTHPVLSFTEPTLQFMPETPNPGLKAVIVDHLSLTVPNSAFVQAVASILTKANYTVDYFSGERVTVDFYRNLPTHGYKIVILRVHSTTGGYPTVCLFTSELYSTSEYVQEQLAWKLYRVSFSPGDTDTFFGIPPSFIESSMKARFQNTVVIMMGCEGLSNTKMAEAFVENGAKACIGWNGSVSARHTDQATTRLLQHLITEGQTIKQSVEKTMKEVGRDPQYQSTLAYYPQ